MLIAGGRPVAQSARGRIPYSGHAGRDVIGIAALEQPRDAITDQQVARDADAHLPVTPAIATPASERRAGKATFAAARLQKLQELIAVVEMDWGRVGRTIDLDRSI